MIRTILIFFYMVINLLLLMFNWSLFTSVVEVDFLFGTINISPILSVQLFGLIILLILWAIEHNKDMKQELQVLKLKQELMEIKKDNEISSLKDQLKKEKVSKPEIRPSNDSPLNKIE